MFEKEIIKHVFLDRTVIYGLPEFGPPILEGTEGKTSANLGFFGLLDRVGERKRLEKERRLERGVQQERMLDAAQYLDDLIHDFYVEHGRPPSENERWKLTQKAGNRFSLDPSKLLAY